MVSWLLQQCNQHKGYIYLTISSGGWSLRSANQPVCQLQLTNGRETLTQKKGRTYLFQKFNFVKKKTMINPALPVLPMWDKEY